MSANLTDQERKAFEAYLQPTATDEERQEALIKLVPGSALHYYLYFLDRLRRLGGKALSAEEQAMYHQFGKKYPHSNEYQQIKARLTLLKYDEAATTQEKENILNEITWQYAGVSFDHYKPEGFHKQGGGSESVSEAEGDAPAQAFGEQAKVYELKYDQYFSKSHVKSRFQSTSDDEATSNSAITRIPEGWEHEIDFTTLFHPRSVYHYFACPGKRITDLQNATFYESLKRFLEEEYRINKHFELNQTLLDKLTLAQLDKLATLHPKVREDKVYIGSYFQKQFSEELSKENQEIWSTEEKRANLLTLYNFAKSKNMPKSLQAALLLEILDLGIKVADYDETLFREYLLFPLATGGQVFTQSRVKESNKTHEHAMHWNRYIANVQQSQQPQPSQASVAPSWTSTQQEMIKKYLEYFCTQKGGTLESFKDDFDKHFLRDIEERIAIYSVEASEGLTKLINQGSDKQRDGQELLRKYREIESETIVRFLESNAELFKVEDEVTLSLELKNVQTLYLKIFEFNTETYYKKTLQPFNTGVNLDGLVASTERAVDEFKDRPSNKKFIESFKFPELNNRVGLFIVEFIGNGLSARAVIKKGSLSMIHKPTVAGHLAYVLDENKKICLGDEGEGRTGIQFDGQYYPARPDKGGKIFIPYGKSNTSAKAILMHNGFAQLCDFERQTEQYSFNAWIHLNSESILIGNKAQLLIKPQLQINNRLASLELIKNGKVTLTTTAYIDSIPVTKTFEGLKFANHKDCVLDFQVPPYLRDISVTLECEVFNITQQTNQKFTSQKTFQVQTQAHTYGMCELFLKKEGGDYFIQLLGKNGEARADASLQVSVIHKWFSPKSGYGGQQITLTTDKDGRVKLGHLKKVVAVSVNSNFLNVKANWFIGNQNGHEGYANMLTYPNQVDVVEGESLEFPIAATKKKTRKNISLIKLWSPSGATFAQGSASSFVVLDDLFEKIEFSKKEDADYSVIKLANMQEGVYKLKLKKLGKTILITVHRGQYWDSDSFILKRNCLFENRAPLKMIKISNVNITPEETKQTYKIRVEDFTHTARLHVFATHFLPTMNNLMFLNLARMQSESGSSAKTVFPFAQWKNILMSNRELSDEFRYVFDRKYLGGQRPLGNTLERPKLLVKRHFLQNTTVDQEQLSGGSAYAQQNMYQEVQSQAIQQRVQVQQQQQVMYSQNIQPHHMMLNSIAPRSQMIAQKAYEFDDYSGGGYGGSGRGEEEFGYDMMLQNSEHMYTETQVIREFQNFLKNPTFTVFNLTPNPQTGEVTFQANLKAYSQLYIVAIDLNSVSQRIIDLGNLEPTAKRDLSLATSLPISSTSGFTESRTTSTVITDSVVTVEDITSTDLQLIDDLKKVRGVLEELMRTNGQGGASGVFKELVPVLLKWNTFDSEEKCKTYYKNLCHELNVFIYLKDRSFFEKVVKQLIECKIEKTFIDLYLLSRYEELVRRFSGIENLNKTNGFEKCLLVDALVQIGKKDEAKKLVDHIKVVKDATTYSTVEQDNKIFDIVLNLNMLKEGSGSGSIALTTSTITTMVGAPSGALFSMSAAPNDPFTAGRFQRFDSASSVDFDQQEYDRHNHAGANRMSNMRAMRAVNLNKNASYGSDSDDQSNSDDEECEEIRHYEMKKKSNVKLFAGKKDRRRDSSRDIMREYASQKKKVRMAFEEIQTTGEYMETHYYKQRAFSSSSGLVNVNAFWHDYANYLLQRGEEGAAKQFLSASFTKNADNQVSAILTFAVLDLPLTDAPSHATKANEGRGMELKAAGNIILFRKEVREAPFEVTNDIIVTHRYIPSNESSENQTSAIPDEFLVNKAYSCEVIMTNVSPKQSTFSLLYQIPQGSLPLQLTKYMKSVQQTLAPYTTQKLIFHFYFPKSGEFSHFPSNVASGEKIIARATGLESRRLKVVRKLSVSKKETFLDIMQSDNRDEDVLEFLRTHNLLKGEKGFSSYQMLWMLKDKDFFKRVLAVYKERMLYDGQVWSYALHHKLVDDEATLREYFMNSQPWNLVQQLGNSFKSKLFTRTLADAEFKALDYFPMVNARAHQVGDLEHWTLNRTFKDTYHTFLRTIAQHSSSERAKSGLEDATLKLVWVQYLQLQDRTDEAIKLFDHALPELLKLSETDGSLRIQVDYMRAYFDFFTGLESGFKIARAIVREYENYPVPQWRIPFLEILDQLNEFDGEMIDDDEAAGEKDLESMTEEQKKQKYKQSIKKEPRLACELNEQKLEIEAANIKQVQVKFYIIDAEILFSRTPFLKTNTEEFSYVKPCHKLELDLAQQEKSSLDTSVEEAGIAVGQVQKAEVKIPEHLKLQNMVIEITGEGKQLFKTYYATQIKVVMTEAYGELKVVEKGESAKPLPRVYVKVFAQKKGSSANDAFFFKDGYTDIRGKFDYAQTSGNRLKDVQKFAILVMSDTLGSIIKECDPPKGDFSGSGAAEAGVFGGTDKAERIINRVNKWHAQKATSKCK